MTRQTHQTHLTEFDLMVIRAGGRTQAELEAMALREFRFRCRICAFLADNLYKIVMRLEASANRSVEGSHRRFIANGTP
jgi:hypothetical protein